MKQLSYLILAFLIISISACKEDDYVEPVDNPPLPTMSAEQYLVNKKWSISKYVVNTETSFGSNIIKTEAISDDHDKDNYCIFHEDGNFENNTKPMKMEVTNTIVGMNPFTTERVDEIDLPESGTWYIEDDELFISSSTDDRVFLLEVITAAQLRISSFNITTDGDEKEEKTVIISFISER